MTITITDDKGRELRLPIRTQEILRCVIELMPQVERITVGTLTLHIPGRSIIPEVSEKHRQSRAEGHETV